MGDMTQLLRSARDGDTRASGALFELLYADLKQMAHGRLYRSGGIAELDTVSLVHESYLRLSGGVRLEAADRQAFFGYVARVMRSVVVDHVRSQQALRRGGDAVPLTLTTGVAAESPDDQRMLAIHDALHTLQRLAPALHELVELRYFAGLSVREVAELRGVSTRTVEREWEKARAFLVQLMREA